MTTARVEYYVPGQGSQDERILATATIPAEILTQFGGETILANLKPLVRNILRAQLAKELWQDDWSFTNIAKFIGIDRKTIYRWKQKHGWKLEKSGSSKNI